MVGVSAVVLSYLIKRERSVGGLVQVQYWNSAVWSSTDAKAYAHKATAERILRSLVQGNEVLPNDVCSIEELKDLARVDPNLA